MRCYKCDICGEVCGINLFWSDFIRYSTFTGNERNFCRSCTEKIEKTIETLIKKGEKSK